MFLEHYNQAHRRDIAIYTEGSKNMQQVGCAAATLIGTLSCKRYWLSELYAIYKALSMAENSLHRKFVIITDSKITTQILKHYNSTHPLVQSSNK